MNKKYYNLFDKYDTDITEDDVRQKMKAGDVESLSDHISLHNIALKLDSAELLRDVYETYRITRNDNLSQIIRNLFREYRKTLDFKDESLSELIRMYPDSLEIIFSTLSEIYGYNITANILNLGNQEKRMALFKFLSGCATDINFPLKDRSVSSIQKIFFLAKEKDDLLNIVGSSHCEMREAELLTFLNIKSSEGLLFSDILMLGDDSIIKHKAFLRAIVLVFNKEPYDLLSAKSNWIKTNALEMISN